MRGTKTKTAKSIHVHYLPYVLFLMLLCLLYIWNRHFAERKVRNIIQLKAQVDDMRADYISHKALLTEQTRRSYIIREAEKLGLKLPEKPPYKLNTRDR